MAKLKVHMVLEKVSLIKILDKISSNKISTRKKLQYYLKKGNIAYFEYILIKHYDENFFNTYNIEFFKYSHRHYFTEYNSEYVLFLLSRFKGFYSLINSKRKDLYSLLDNYIKEKDRRFYDIGELNCFIEICIYTLFGNGVLKNNLIYVINKYPEGPKVQSNKHKLVNVEGDMYMLYVITTLIKMNYKHIVKIGNTKIPKHVKIYIDSLGIDYKTIFQGGYIDFTFKPTIFLIDKNIYKEDYSNFFSHENHCVLMI